MDLPARLPFAISVNGPVEDSEHLPPRRDDDGRWRHPSTRRLHSQAKPLSLRNQPLTPEQIKSPSGLLARTCGLRRKALLPDQGEGTAARARQRFLLSLR